MFLSAVLTLILTAPIHCKGSIGDVKINFLQICPDEETNPSSIKTSSTHMGKKGHPGKWSNNQPLDGKDGKSKNPCLFMCV